MSVWDYSENPELNQYRQGLDFHEGQTTSTVPASLRLLMQQMAQYANLQRILALSGKTEKLSINMDIPPQEFLCQIPAAASGVKGNIIFVLNNGDEVQTAYPRADYAGYYIVRLPEGIITSTASKAVPAGTICHFWGAVPAGWEDITEKYKGRYIEGGVVADIGKTFAGTNKRHAHKARSGDKRENKTVHLDFQEPTGSVHAGNGHGGVNSEQYSRGEHAHALDIREDGGDSPKPQHIVLRLGVKL